MPINYERMRATATRLVGGNGTEFAVTRKGSVKMIGGKEVKEPDLAFTATGVRTDYRPGEIDGTVILNGDVRIVFTADSELRVGDMVSIDGKQHRIINPNPVKPATLLLCYRAQLRA